MLTGEQACEDQGFTQLECEAVGCCHFENEVCHSAVGDALCSDSSVSSGSWSEPISCAFENISVSEISSGGDPSDFIELYNSGDVNCSIGGFRLIGDNGTGSVVKPIPSCRFFFPCHDRGHLQDEADSIMSAILPVKIVHKTILNCP